MVGWARKARGEEHNRSREVTRRLDREMQFGRKGGRGRGKKRKEGGGVRGERRFQKSRTEQGERWARYR